MKVKLITLVVVLMSVVTTNAQKNKEKELEMKKPTLIGKWTLAGTNQGGEFITADSAKLWKATLVINENDTYEINHEKTTERGTYIVEGGKLILTDSSTKEKTELHATTTNMLSLAEYDEEDGIYIYFKKNKK